MKLLSVQMARSIWLGRLDDLNPKGINIYPIIVPILVNDYKFIKYPSQADAINETNGIKFEEGEFNSGKDYPVRMNLTIYDDGLVATSISDTDDTDLFLKDILEKFYNIFKMSRYEEIITRKTYLSEISVTTEKNIEILNPKFKEISLFLSENFDLNTNFELSGISFLSNIENKISTPPFKFERASNVPFKEKRYYSVAPLETKKHLLLLDKLENIIE